MAYSKEPTCNNAGMNSVRIEVTLQILWNEGEERGYDGELERSGESDEHENGVCQKGHKRFWELC